MSAPYRPVTLDDSTPLLTMSYRLRYQTFCLERLFFDKAAYPSQLESDSFDKFSVHVGVLSAEDELVGTARIVSPSGAGLPLLRYCRLFPGDTTLEDPANTVVELSRVCLKRDWDAPRASTTGQLECVAPRSSSRMPGRASDDPFAALIKAVYVEAKRLHATHWIVAIEKALRRRLLRYGLPFHLAGPEVDYFGPVAPYVLNVDELDDVIRRREYLSLDDLPVDVDADYWPSPVSQTSV